jgi:hypothetical protein
MPTHADGYLIPYTAAQVAAMQIESFGIRDRDFAIESRRWDENVMTRRFMVKWSKRFEFVEHVLGDSKLWVDGATTKLSRLLPDTTFGRHPDSQQICATRIDDIRPHDAGIDNAAQFPQAVKAEITVFYEHRPFVIGSQGQDESEKNRFVTMASTIDSDAEAFTLPGGSFVYTTPTAVAPQNVPVPMNVSVVRPVERFVLWWEELPAELLFTGGALYKRLYLGQKGVGSSPDGVPFIGTVNKETFTIPSAGQQYDPGQLLLEGVQRVKLLSPLAASGFGGFRYKCGFKFAFTPRGWLDLFYFDPGTPANSGYYRVSVDGTYYTVPLMPDHRGLYNTRDHNKLFDPNWD